MACAGILLDSTAPSIVHLSNEQHVDRQGLARSSLGIRPSGLRELNAAGLRLTRLALRFVQDKDGYITLKEFRAFHEKHNKDNTAIEKAFAAIDADKNGMVTFEGTTLRAPHPRSLSPRLS